MIKEAKRLYDLGLALHWLHPKSKMPIGSGWSRGPRKTWEDLSRQFREGMNLGVRLGEPSRFPDGSYLAVIDCDVKGVEVKHEKEMLARLSELTRSNNVVVMSGRGNGSRHIYVRTAWPQQGFRYTASKHQVKVYMPSVEARRKDREALNPTEIEAGFRMRPAWEISVMGDKQQVVVPPSVHPDSDKPYKWKGEFQGYEDLPLVEFTQTRRVEQSAEVTRVEWEDVELEMAPIPRSTYELIENGEGGSDDRSADMLKAAIVMVKHGMTDAQIIGVFTDRANHLGSVAYDHAKTDDRNRAAQWVARYTLAKAKNTALALADFKVEDQTPTLEESGASAQAAELGEATHWTHKLERSQAGRTQPTQNNLMAILKHEAGDLLFVRNEFTGTDEFGIDAPWSDAKEGQEVRDIDLINISFWLSREHGVEFSDNKILSSMREIADKNRYHPVQDFLYGLEWDGKPRLDTWLVDYLGAKGDTKYLAGVGRKLLCAMVARVMEPGCKFDHVVILEGEQGIGKSTAARILGGEWFSDAFINIGDKDAVLNMHGVWVLELGELSGMRKADVDLLKEFVSRTTDRLRLPYGKLSQNFPRQCVFIGTTNSTEYLKDKSGNRRFWPVEVTKCDQKKLRKIRKQLLAEAMVQYQLGEPLYFEDKEIEMLAKSEQKKRLITDSLADELEEMLSSKIEGFDPKKFTLKDITSDFFLSASRASRGYGRRVADPYFANKVGEILKNLGYKNARLRENGVRKSYWIK